jgi:hypothetical protein
VNLQRLEPHAGELVRVLKLDPVTILLIIQALAAIISMVRDCREMQGVTWDRTIQRGRESRWQRRMRHVVLRRIGADDYQKIGGDQFLDAVRSHAAGLSHADLDELVCD